MANIQKTPSLEKSIYEITSNINNYQVNCENQSKKLAKSLLINGEIIGKMPYKTFEILEYYKVACTDPREKGFEVKENSVEINFEINTMESNTPNKKNDKEKVKIVSEILKNICDIILHENLNDDIKTKIINGLRFENYAVYNSCGIVAEIERSMCGYLGIRTYGCYLNAYCRNEITNEYRIWISRRAMSKSTYPGMLDQVVAGGLTSGLTPLVNMIKECYEEAGIEICNDNSGDFSEYDLKPCGTVCSWQETDYEIEPSTSYVYDLMVPDEFKPKNMDGEVEEFYLLSPESIIERLEEFKPNACLVMIDFLIRHRLINNIEPNYTKICGLLHTSFPFADPVY